MLLSMIMTKSTLRITVSVSHRKSFKWYMWSETTNPASTLVGRSCELVTCIICKLCIYCTQRCSVHTTYMGVVNSCLNVYLIMNTQFATTLAKAELLNLQLWASWTRKMFTRSGAWPALTVQGVGGGEFVEVSWWGICTKWMLAQGGGCGGVWGGYSPLRS